MSVLQKEAHDRQGDNMPTIFSCIETLVTLDVSRDAEEAEAAEMALDILAELMSLRFSRMSLRDLVGWATQLSELIGKCAHVERMLLPVYRSGVQREADAASNWDEFADLVDCVCVLKDLTAFASLLPGIATLLAQKAVDSVLRGGDKLLPEGLVRCTTELQTWPAALQEATMALRHVLPGRLEELARRCAEDPPAVEMSICWWVDTLRAVGEGGLVDRAKMRSICDLLAPVLAREDVKTPATMTWSLESRQFVVARQLAREIFDHPQETQYSPTTKTLLFGCPLTAGSPEPAWQSSSASAAQQTPSAAQQTSSSATQQTPASRHQSLNASQFVSRQGSAVSRSSSSSFVENYRMRRVRSERLQVAPLTTNLGTNSDLRVKRSATSTPSSTPGSSDARRGLFSSSSTSTMTCLSPTSPSSPWRAGASTAFRRTF